MNTQSETKTENEACPLDAIVIGLNDTGKIFNEDCLHTMAKMPDNAVDYVFTSPPYNRKRNDKYTHYNDQIDDFYQFLVDFTEESLRVSKNGVFINIMKNYYNKEDVFRYMGNFADKISEVFVWEKSNPLPASGNNITNAYEFVFMFGDMKSNTTYTKNHLTTSVAIMGKEHKAVMHLRVAEFFIKNFTQRNEVIYDPFFGTGTTAIACHKLNRKWIGSEISKEYVGIAKKRLKPYLEQSSLAL